MVLHHLLPLLSIVLMGWILWNLNKENDMTDEEWQKANTLLESLERSKRLGADVDQEELLEAFLLLLKDYIERGDE